MFAHYSAGTGTHLHRAKPGAVIDEQGRSLSFATALLKARPIFFGQLSGTQFRLIDLADGGQHTKDQALRRHLQAEYQAPACLCARTAFSTRFMANAVLPIEGLPATIIRSDFCQPEVISSRSV